MKLLLTSAGTPNAAFQDALPGLLEKPISASNALFVPTGMYPFPGGARMAREAVFGRSTVPLAQLGWKSVGLLELTALSSIDKKIWAPDVEQADALLVYGGDVLYLSYWMRQSGLAGLFPSLPERLVYVGVSAGSMAVSSIFGEACTNPPSGNHDAL